MKILARTIVLLVSLLPALALATEAGINSTTLFRFEERSIPGFSKQTVVPATQFIGADLGKIGDENLSFHFYGWGRLDLADRSTAEGDTDGDLTYGYLKYHFPKANSEIKAGRFFTFEGGVAEQIDGVAARADLLPAYAGLALSLFSGAPVKLDRANDNKGDYIVGGRLSYRYASIIELGASAVHEGGMDRNGPNSDLKNYRQTVGGDIWLSPHKMVELNGRTYYNTATSGISEHSYHAIVTPLAGLLLAAEFNQNYLKDFFSASSLRSLFNPDGDDKLTTFGAGITYTIAKPVELTLDYKHFARDTRKDSNRFGGELRLTLADGKVRSGLSYHRVDAGERKASAGLEGFPITSYNEVRGFALYTKDKYDASLDSIVHIFDNKIFNTKTAYEIQASAGYRIMPSLKLSGDLSYGDNPQQSDEVKGLIRLTFNYNYASKGAGK
jgi:hypothetical protein